MKSEKDRLLTYVAWPNPYIDPQKLVKAGFFSRWSNTCPFVRGVKVGNIPVVLSLTQGAKLREASNVNAPVTLVVTAEKFKALAATAVCEEKEPKKVDDGRLCKICYTEELGVVFLSCGHIMACVKCAPSLSTCAVCRQPFTATVGAFLS